MNHSDLQKQLRQLEKRRLALTGKANKKKRNKINRSILNLQARLTASELVIPSDQFDLSTEELHRVYSHVECINAQEERDVGEMVFDVSNLIAKCAPALLIPISSLKKLGFERTNMSWTGMSPAEPNIVGHEMQPHPSEVLKWHYIRKGSKSKEQVFDVRWIFEDEEASKKAFEDEAFIADVLETDTTGPYMFIRLTQLPPELKGTVCSKGFPGQELVVAWRDGLVVAKLFLVGVKKHHVFRFVRQAQEQTRQWFPCEELLAKLCSIPNYRKIVVGLRLAIQPKGFKRLFPIAYETKFGQKEKNFITAMQLKCKTEKNRKKKTIQIKHRCAFCQKIAYMKCARCSKAYYCNASCQAEHYDTHRKECKRKKQSAKHI